MAETGSRFSAFGPGPDGGIDGRHSKGDHLTILQCKHFVGSTFSNLKTALRKEIPKLKLLKPKKYLFLTSQSLTPKKSNELAEIIGDYLQNPEDIWGLEDIEAAIDRNPDIEKSHIKLWLSSAAVLERVLHSGLEAFTQVSKEDILDDLRVYARNESFNEAVKKLEEEQVLIVSGPPGVGKTTLANMVAYHHLNQGARFHAIKSLNDGFTTIDENKPTIFFFDDFLGRIELDRQSLVQRDTALAQFVKRIRRSKNARFILTTRAHIFEEARRISDHVDDRKLQLAKYLLDVGKYTRKIKSHILFNHLYASDLSDDYFRNLLLEDNLKKIIDHKNYNPRLIAAVAADCPDSVIASEYPNYVLSVLDNPELIWSKPYKALSMRSQNLLVALYFGSQYLQSIAELRLNFEKMHRHVSSHYNQPTSPDDFEEALHSLESGFISISGQTVNFVNPSVRDFLKSHLQDQGFLILLAEASVRSDWAESLWNHMKKASQKQAGKLKLYASAFASFQKIIGDTPSVKRRKTNSGYWSESSDDLILSSRVAMLLEWWKHSNDGDFFETAFTLVSSDTVELVSDRDAQYLPNLYHDFDYLVDGSDPRKVVFLQAIEKKLVESLQGGIPSDAIASVVEAIDEYMAEFDLKLVNDAVDELVSYELNQTSDAISHLDSEDQLAEHIDTLDRLAKITGYDASRAKSIVDERMAEIQMHDYDDYTPQSSGSKADRVGDFSDTDMASLFSNLIRN